MDAGTSSEGSQGTHSSMLGGQAGPSPGQGSGNSSPIISKRNPRATHSAKPVSIHGRQASEMCLAMLSHVNPLGALSVAQGPVLLTLHLNTEGLQHSSPPQTRTFLTVVGFFRETEVPLTPTASCMAILRFGPGSLASVAGQEGTLPLEVCRRGLGGPLAGWVHQTGHAGSQEVSGGQWDSTATV